MSEVSVAQVESIEPGCSLRVEVRGTALCVGRLDDGSPFAIADECTHDEVELSDGYLDGDEIECPAHGSRFNVRTGEVRGLPANIPVRVYPIAVRGGALVVDVE
jgi:3-phenylpropionate/trans-cinnamate dioxygenase ferredoxin component